MDHRRYDTTGSDIPIQSSTELSLIMNKEMCPSDRVLECSMLVEEAESVT